MKKDYTLYYDTVNSGKDIERHEFDSHAQMIDFIVPIIYDDNKDCVFLLSKDDLEDVFVSKGKVSVVDFWHTRHSWQTSGNHYLFECETYDEAYSLATDISNTNRAVNFKTEWIKLEKFLLSNGFTERKSDFYNGRCSVCFEGGYVSIKDCMTPMCAEEFYEDGYFESKDHDIYEVQKILYENNLM